MFNKAKLAVVQILHNGSDNVQLYNGSDNVQLYNGSDNVQLYIQKCNARLRRQRDQESINIIVNRFAFMNKKYFC